MDIIFWPTYQINKFYLKFSAQSFRSRLDNYGHLMSIERLEIFPSLFIGNAFWLKIEMDRGVVFSRENFSNSQCMLISFICRDMWGMREGWLVMYENMCVRRRYSTLDGVESEGAKRTLSEVRYLVWFAKLGLIFNVITILYKIKNVVTLIIVIKLKIQELFVYAVKVFS